ncbi:Nn.00g048400.m01.CDS01 [Neocucurbitaria sp. VM-36]
MELLDFSSPTLKVMVGEEGNEEDFWVHQKILTSRSEFFKRATNGQWLESDERLITLPEDRPDVFRLYLNLLYTRQVATKSWRTLCQVYVLAEKLQDASAKNSVIDAMHVNLISLGWA